MKQPSNVSPGAGPGTAELGPAATYVMELQTISGAHDATGEPAPGTPGQPGVEAPAPGFGGGSASPASPAAPADPYAPIMEFMQKISTRLDAQANYLTKLGTKVDRVASERDEFETRYRQAPSRQAAPAAGEEGDPPGFDPDQFAKTITERVLTSVNKAFEPLVAQTKANSAQQRVIGAQADPEVARLVAELPPQVRANLTNEVFRITGNRMFEEQNPMFDAPDPVSEAIELIHFRTVGKASRQAGGQANQPQPRKTTVNLSPVPHQGTHRATPGRDEVQAAAEDLYQEDFGEERARYPAAIERQLGMSR